MKMLKNELENYLSRQIGEKIHLEMTKEEKFGDFSTNVAFLLAKKSKKTPVEMAKELVSKIKQNQMIEKIEIASPGFINIYLSKKWLTKNLDEILKQKEDFGSNNLGQGKKVLVEFISANPTGPLHIGNARGGPIGDIIANVLSRAGFKVTREFYVNDVGNQVNIFGKTLLYWYLKKQGKKIKFPEGGYQGNYVKEIAGSIKSPKKVSAEYFARHGIKKIIKQIKKDCQDMGIVFDNFIYESDILKKHETKSVISKLIKHGLAKEKEGALWFLQYVLLRSDKEKTPTYFANDLAYHLNKYHRKFDQAIDVLGANTYGHIQKMEDALKALGVKKEFLKIILYQFVRLKHGEKVEKMSKRLGTYVTARQVLDEVNKDVFRFMMAERAPETHLDFDLKLAKKQSEENPVYYIQYASARIHGILAKLKIKNEKLKIPNKNLKLLINPAEISLIKHLIRFPDLIYEVTDDLAVHKITLYALKLATAFHHFYEKCRVIDEKNQAQKKARIIQVMCTQIVLKNTLDILGIEAKKRM